MITDSNASRGDYVAALIRAARVEVIPLKGAEAKISGLTPGATVTITCSPKFGLARTLEHVELVAQRGYRVVPHLAARQVVDQQELKAFADRVAEFGVTDLYVIGGDASEPAGDYSCAADLLADLATMKHSFSRIGVACYPEGHPKIANPELVDALLKKQRYATYMVSQMCFDGHVIIRWLEQIRASGVTLPLRVGLAGPMSTRKLLELSLRIGVGASVRYLTKQHGLVANLLLGNSYRPETLLEQMDPQILADRRNIEGLHLFSFNQIGATADWQRDIDGAA